MVSYDEFFNAVTKAGYPAPSVDVYLNFVSGLETQGGITNKREAAMLLTHVLVETGGLTQLSETRCIESGCPGEYLDPNYPFYPNRNYYGRGYIQLVNKSKFSFYYLIHNS